jgi:hypothetical protein
MERVYDREPVDQEADSSEVEEGNTAATLSRVADRCYVGSPNPREQVFQRTIALAATSCQESTN